MVSVHKKKNGEMVPIGMVKIGSVSDTSISALLVAQVWDSGGPGCAAQRREHLGLWWSKVAVGHQHLWERVLWCCGTMYGRSGSLSSHSTQSSLNNSLGFNASQTMLSHCFNRGGGVINCGQQVADGDTAMSTSTEAESQGGGGGKKIFAPPPPPGVPPKKKLAPHVGIFFVRRNFFTVCFLNLHGTFTLPHCMTLAHELPLR